MREKSVQAAKYYHEHGARVIIASGGETPLLDPKYKSEAEMICNTLIKEGVPKDKIILDEESKDNVGNIVNSLRHVHGHDIGIVSYPKHLDRFEHIIEKGKEEGVFDKNLRVHRIETNQSLAERLYEIPAGIITKRSLRKGVNSAKIPEGLMKKVANYLMKKFS
ncbi:MAG: YdcF family protein [Nanoarchaeota archaeon]